MITTFDVNPNEPSKPARRGRPRNYVHPSQPPPPRTLRPTPGPQLLAHLPIFTQTREQAISTIPIQSATAPKNHRQSSMSSRKESKFLHGPTDLPPTQYGGQSPLRVKKPPRQYEDDVTDKVTFMQSVVFYLPMVT